MNYSTTSSELGRALAALRRPVERPCAVCGKPMVGMAHRRTCSNACRAKAQRLRNAAKRTHEKDA
jgi:hypothetical protein